MSDFRAVDALTGQVSDSPIPFILVKPDDTVEGLRAKLEDYRAELDNVCGMLRDAGANLEKVTKEYAQCHKELETTRDCLSDSQEQIEELAVALRDAEARIHALIIERAELNGGIKMLNRELEAVRAERDTARGAASGGGVL